MSVYDTTAEERSDELAVEQCSVCDRYTDSNHTLHIRADDGRLVDSASVVCEHCVDEVLGR